MGTLIKDMSRVRPAPTVRRETSALVASLALVIPFFVAVFILLEETRELNAVLGAVLLVYLLGRWGYAVARGDVGGHPLRR